jgi:hypothetical protein
VTSYNHALPLALRPSHHWDDMHSKYLGGNAIPENWECLSMATLASALYKDNHSKFASLPPLSHTHTAAPVHPCPRRRAPLSLLSREPFLARKLFRPGWGDASFIAVQVDCTEPGTPIQIAQLASTRRSAVSVPSIPVSVSPLFSATRTRTRAFVRIAPPCRLRTQLMASCLPCVFRRPVCDLILFLHRCCVYARVIIPASPRRRQTPRSQGTSALLALEPT